MPEAAAARSVQIRDRESSLEASFVPGLGMVIASLRHEGEELLGQRGGLEAYALKGSTFAIPLLYPWANRLSGWEYTAAGKTVALDRADPLIHQDAARGIPMHGLLAASPHWQLTDADLDRISAELDFAAVPEYMRSFPYAHRLSYDAAINRATLSVTLTVTATGEDPVPVSFGFHPYLSLPGSERDGWMVELPVKPPQAPGVLAGRAYDEQFTEFSAPGAPTFTLADTKRRVAVTFIDNYPVTQIYSPAGSDYICFEPMTAPADALRSGDGLQFAHPGHPFSATFAITVTAV